MGRVPCHAWKRSSGKGDHFRSILQPGYLKAPVLQLEANVQPYSQIAFKLTYTSLSDSVSVRNRVLGLVCLPWWPLEALERGLAEEILMFSAAWLKSKLLSLVAIIAIPDLRLV